MYVWGECRSSDQEGLPFLGWCEMDFKSFQIRYAGLISFGKTIGILFIVINLASAFVLERYTVARVAMEVKALEDETSRLRRAKEYLHSKVSHLESLERISTLAGEMCGLRSPSPDQIVWISEDDLLTGNQKPLINRTIDRFRHLYAELPVPAFSVSSATADEGGSSTDE